MNPQDYVVTALYFRIGGGVRNDIRLWKRNPELFASCGTHDAEECWEIILRCEWAMMRRYSDRRPVQALDCQYRALAAIRARSDEFEDVRMEVAVNRLRSYLASAAPTCGAPIDIRIIGAPALQRWATIGVGETPCASYIIPIDGSQPRRIAIVPDFDDPDVYPTPWTPEYLEPMLGTSWGMGLAWTIRRAR
jgi:hypothetical protein